jgi:hypothetical protein
LREGGKDLERKWFGEENEYRMDGNEFLKFDFFFLLKKLLKAKMSFPHRKSCPLPIITLYRMGYQKKQSYDFFNTANSLCPRYRAHTVLESFSPTYICIYIPKFKGSRTAMALSTAFRERLEHMELTRNQRLSLLQVPNTNTNLSPLFGCQENREKENKSNTLYNLILSFYFHLL